MASIYLHILSIQGRADEVVVLAELVEKQQDQINAVIFWSLIPFILVFVFLFFVIYRSRREAAFRKRTYDLELARAQMEMTALRAQVNPHFIFNCLASIQDFISNKDNEQAEYFLVRFSRLIRQVLENSSQRMVALSDDLETLALYVEMESLRLDNAFSYRLDIDESIDPEQIFVPPLLVQPLIENAIWHGSRADGVNQITMSICREGSDIVCVVENPTSSDESTSVGARKGKSMGLSLIRDRIKLFNHLYSRQEEVLIEEVGIPATGEKTVRVTVVLPFETDE